MRRRYADRVPRAVTADCGYDRAAVEQDLLPAGVRTVAIPRQITTSLAVEHRHHDQTQTYHDDLCWRRVLGLGRESSPQAVRAERRSRPWWDPVDLRPGSRTKRSISELHECKLIELDE